MMWDKEKFQSDLKYLSSKLTQIIPKNIPMSFQDFIFTTKMFVLYLFAIVAGQAFYLAGTYLVAWEEQRLVSRSERIFNDNTAQVLTSNKILDSKRKREMPSELIQY